MASDELLRKVIQEVLTEVQRPTIASAATPRAQSGSVQTPRGATLPILPTGAEPAIDYCLMCVEQEKGRSQKRAVLTTTGRNTKGIVAKVTQVIADAGGDILDISQTLVSGYFTMIIIVDIASLETSFEEFKSRVTSVSGSLGLQTIILHEDVVQALHRV